MLDQCNDINQTLIDTINNNENLLDKQKLIKVWIWKYISKIVRF